MGAAPRGTRGHLVCKSKQHPESQGLVPGQRMNPGEDDGGVTVQSSSRVTVQEVSVPSLGLVQTWAWPGRAVKLLLVCQTRVHRLGTTLSCLLWSLSPQTGGSTETRLKTVFHTASPELQLY